MLSVLPFDVTPTTFLRYENRRIYIWTSVYLHELHPTTYSLHEEGEGEGMKWDSLIVAHVLPSSHHKHNRPA